MLVLRRRPGRPAEGLLAVGDSVLPCAIGRSGITVRKHEGDGATPRARLRLIAVLWRGDRLARPRTALPARAIRATDGWCDAPRHGRYNRFVRTPFAPSHEDLSRADGLYDVVVVLDWNIRPRIDRAGSAIFLHVAGRKAEEGRGPEAGAAGSPRRRAASPFRARPSSASSPGCHGGPRSSSPDPVRHPRRRGRRLRLGSAELRHEMID
ncbi:L,D-transpeptidase family protein [Segnochrobactrum spirostomi]|uniref:L,D-transpeptidase family protein n=1 Tax=Segnochrobactrum spirostomi TaxID=2608987 RepID=UPI001FE6439F|nr:L,D-transpeptidase family protein [Segnochrobactrum spirostomi]